MRMITLFMPESYLEKADSLVTKGWFPNRSEAFRYMIMSYIDKECSGKPIDEPIKPEQKPDEIQKEEHKPVALIR